MVQTCVINRWSVFSMFNKRSKKLLRQSRTMKQKVYYRQLVGDETEIFLKHFKVKKNLATPPSQTLSNIIEGIWKVIEIHTSSMLLSFFQQRSFVYDVNGRAILNNRTVAIWSALLHIYFLLLLVQLVRVGFKR